MFQNKYMTFQIKYNIIESIILQTQNKWQSIKYRKQCLNYVYPSGLKKPSVHLIPNTSRWAGDWIKGAGEHIMLWIAEIQTQKMPQISKAVWLVMQ